MALTKTGGTGSITSLAGVDTITGNVTASGTGAESAVLVAADLTIAGGSSVTFAALTASAASTINVTDNSIVTVAGASGTALNNFTIGTGGQLILDSGVSLAASQTISFTDPTGALAISQALVSASLLDTIQGFQPGNSLTLDGASYTPSGSSYDPATGVLTLAGSNGTPDATLDLELASGLTGPEFLNFTATGGNETITLSPTDTNGIPACYLRGTMILTDRGDVAVENLSAGDLVMTASGTLRPIRWIGHRAYSERFLVRNPGIYPVLFQAGSLPGGLPTRDLFVSPKHAMYLDGALYPADCLVNGTTVLAGQRMAEVAYYHVELERHDVLIAEGALSESYVEDHNRAMFHNAGSYRAAYPQAVECEAVYCAARIESGPELEAIRRKITEVAPAADRARAA